MTDKQEPDIVERLRKYPADPTMCDDYSAAMLDAADEIERLRAPPAQPADDIHSCSYYCDRPACVKRQRDELRDAQPAPAQEPQRLSDERIRELVIDYGVESLRLGSEEARYSAGVGGSNYRASFLRAKRAEALKRVERAIEATIVPPGYVVLEIESVREIITDIEQHIGQGKESEKKEAAERPGYGTGTYTHLWRKMQKLRAMTRAER